MCTSLTLQSLDNKNFLARTMDFFIDFNESVHLIPRNFSFVSIADKKEYKSLYATLGMSILLNNHPILADGINEKGLSIATLYFPGYASYEKSNVEGKNNLAPYDFVYWALSKFQSIDELTVALENVKFIDIPLEILGVTPPLHWIVTDNSGKTITIENSSTGLTIIENPVGVMTNSPDINWQLTNLRQYISLNPNQNKPTSFNNLKVSAFGQGSGSFGLPGDYTPPSRFIRASYLKNNIQNIDNEIDTVTALFHILSNCEVPKGAVLLEDGHLDYTIYKSVICSTTCTYYYNSYNNSQISAINLLKEDLNSTEIKKYPIKKKEAIDFQN